MFLFYEIWFLYNLGKSASKAILGPNLDKMQGRQFVQTCSPSPLFTVLLVSLVCHNVDKRINKNNYILIDAEGRNETSKSSFLNDNRIQGVTSWNLI